MSVPARRWAWSLLIALAAILLASAVLLIIRNRAHQRIETRTYIPLTGQANWHGDWELSTRGADPSQAGSLAGTDRVTIPFSGTGLALRVRRGNYRAYLWIRIDGEPANRLPETERGAYLVLSSPDYEPETVTVPVASGLDDGSHVAEIVADRGWDQWPLIGWQEVRGPDPTIYDQALEALAAGAVICLVGALISGARWRRSRGLGEPFENARAGQTARGEDAKDAGPRPLDFERGAIVRSLGGLLCSPASLLATAGLFYLSPWLPLTLVSGAALAGLIVVRLDLGLALVALSAPFYLHPRPLFGKSFSMAEILILLCLVSWMLRQLSARKPARSYLKPLSSPDLAVVSLVLVAAVSTLFAARRHLALRELRVVVLEPALFYLMLCGTNLDEKASWRLADAFVAGAVGVALIGLTQYALDINVITAEQDFRRLRSVYGSPNNAALYLGRALPILLAVTALARTPRRRLIYGLFVAPVALAILLSFSRAAILVGVPCSLLILSVLAGGRWRWVGLGLIVIAALGIIPLLTTPRFAGLLDPQSGTLFFRLQLWRSSWKMLSHHPWLGVGPDNFLYEYRGRYILPSAWQEPHLSHAHNMPLTFATRLGIPGLVIGVWLHAAFWRHSLALGDGQRRLALSTPVPGALRLGLMGSMAYTLAHGLVDASYFFPDLAIAFLFGLGLVQCGRRYSNDDEGR